MRRFRKIIKELNAKNIKGDNSKSFKGYLYYNILLLEYLLNLLSIIIKLFAKANS